MRILFAGTPEFARQALAGLLDAGHTVALVLTQPDRQAGRGLKTLAGPVKLWALQHSLPVFQPGSLKDPASLAPLRAARPDVVIVAAYGLILPQSVLDLAPNGALNIHASLLPRWRGAAPIQRALLAGDQASGVSIMQMDAGLDTGPVIEQASVPIAEDETAGSLHDKLAGLGAKMMTDVLRRAECGLLSAIPQPEAGVTYAHKIEKHEASIDWRRSSIELDRLVRAFNPVPGARSEIEGVPLKIWRAHPAKGWGPGRGQPGEVQASGPQGVVVTCGEGALVLDEMQRGGGKRLGLREFLLGHPIATGAFFSSPGR